MTEQPNTEQAYCVIGAGPAGICAAKHLSQWGLPFELVEREDDIGGTWNYGRSCCRVYETVHLLTSRKLTEYTDYPMPTNWPDFPNRAMLQEYLRSYVDHFDLRRHMKFNTSVTSITPTKDEAWDVKFESGKVQRYRGVFVATGHLWDPVYPAYSGRFSGTTLHAANYRSSDILRHRRVLIIGAGNSGCDIAVEAAQVGLRALHSSRRTYYCMPKYFLGHPMDQIEEFLLRLRLPSRIPRLVDRAVNYAVSGRLVDPVSVEEPDRLALSRPDKFEQQIVFNDLLPHYIRHGDIVSKPRVESFDGDQVIFADGTRESVDVVIYATGYKTSFPFIDEAILNMQNGYPKLYLHIFPPAFENLFLIGLAHPNGGIWQMAEQQCRLVMSYLWAKSNKRKAAARFDSTKQRYLKRNAQSSPPPDSGMRYYIGVERFRYAGELSRLARELFA